MNWLDIAIVTVIALSVLLGLFRGVVREVLSLVVWVLSFWLAINYSYRASAWFTGVIPYENARLGAAFLLIFIAVLVAGAILSGLVARLVRAGGLGVIDRLLGALFGLLRGVMVVTVLVMLAALTPLAHDGAWRNSLLVGYFAAVSSWAAGGPSGTPGEFGI